mgnify:FL=1
MRKLFPICFLFISLGIGSKSHSQIVNVESSRMQSDTVGWSGNLGASFGIQKNTDKIFTMGLGSQLQYKTSSDLGLWLILGNLNLLKIGSNRFVSDGLAHLRYNRKVNEWLRWEFFGQYQNNIITQIDSRILLGTGPRFKLVKIPSFRMYAACLFMYENEKERTTPKIKHSDLRNSSYLSFSWFPRDNITMISTTYFQPQVSKLSDFRIMNQISFTVDATPHLGLTVNWNYLHDRFPAGTAPKTTYNFGTGITYKIK